MTDVPVYLVRGDDDVLREQAVVELVDRLVGDGDRSLLVEELAGPDYEIGVAVDAAQTPPFLTDHRVVVVRHLNRVAKPDGLAALVDYLADPLPSTRLVLVWEKTPDGRGSSMRSLPAALNKAVQGAGGEVVDSSAPRGKAFGDWVGQHLGDAGLRLDGRAQREVVDRIGDDAGALVGLIARLKGVYGEDTTISAEDLAPFLGEAGGVPPWELTDAIDKGDVALALDRLHRMVGGGARHSLAIMATLQSHFLRMVRLDGAEVRGEKDAAALLGIKGSTFPAKKALNQARRLGHEGVVRAVALLAEADADLRGARAWPDSLIMEVLVARLARLAGTARPARR